MEPFRLETVGAVRSGLKYLWPGAEITWLPQRRRRKRKKSNKNKKDKKKKIKRIRKKNKENEKIRTTRIIGKVNIIRIIWTNKKKF